MCLPSIQSSRVKAFRWQSTDVTLQLRTYSNKLYKLPQYFPTTIFRARKKISPCSYFFSTPVYGGPGLGRSHKSKYISSAGIENCTTSLLYHYMVRSTLFTSTSPMQRVMQSAAEDSHLRMKIGSCESSAKSAA